MKQVASIFLTVIRVVVYILAWLMELAGKILLTSSESIFKLQK